MRIFVTNDDGINSEGLRALERVAHTLSDDVWVIAPETQQSATSHSLTLHTPLRIRKIDDRHFTVNGTPTDCVMLGVREIMAKVGKPDLLLSGINHGSNLGEDVTYSGTVAAAMEGTLLDIPSIAFSQEISRGKPVKWSCGERFASELIHAILKQGIPANTLVNVNFPDREAHEVKGIRVVPQGKRKIGDNIVRCVDPEDRPYYWIGGQRNEDKERGDTDLAAMREGYITLTPLTLDLTHYAILENWNSHFAQEF